MKPRWCKEKFYYDKGRNNNYIKLRSLFYLEVLKWQMNNRDAKRFYYKDLGDSCEIKTFLGPKKVNIFIDEAEIIIWSINLKGDKENAKKRIVRNRERKNYLEEFCR